MPWSKREELADLLSTIEARGPVVNGAFNLNAYSLADVILESGWLRRVESEAAADAIDAAADSSLINAAGILGPWDDIVFDWLLDLSAKFRKTETASTE